MAARYQVPKTASRIRRNADGEPMDTERALIGREANRGSGVDSPPKQVRCGGGAGAWNGVRGQRTEAKKEEAWGVKMS